jgi:alkanesulfonate monooxygenase SsuD/methylene tetrahydromethanopterin reductase-like flavin-dependent oxidoreductase (luciferase family)
MTDVWAFYLFTTQDYKSHAHEVTWEQTQDAFDNWTRLVERLETWGFDGVSFAEHHFMTTCVGGSPHLLIANLAGRTSKLRFTTLGAVLNMHFGWRYIEECAMLDALTHGRFEPGIGPGSGAGEAIIAGFPAEHARPRYQSGADMLYKSLEGPYLTFKDEFYNLDKVGILPRWQPREGQSVWVTVMSPESVVQAAQRGWKICTAWMPIAAATKLADVYREAADNAGFAPDPRNIGLRRRVFVADSDAEAREKFEAAVDLMPYLVNTSSGAIMEAADERIMQMFKAPDDFAIGSPKTVAEMLIEQCRAGGFGTIAAWADFASFRWADLERSHELLGTQVIPALRSAGAAQNQVAA